MYDSNNQRVVIRKLNMSENFPGECQLPVNDKIVHVMGMTKLKNQTIQNIHLRAVMQKFDVQKFPHIHVKHN